MTQVTRKWMIDYINTQPRPKVERMVGRALVALLRRQTEAEQIMNSTTLHNDVGFTGADGRSGCLTAKSYLKNKRLLDWQLNKWTKPNKRGIPRIAKYWKQLDEVAKEREQAVINKLKGVS